MIFIVSIVFILLQQKTKTNLIKKYVKKDFCNVVIPSEETKILEFDQYQKSDKAPITIYAGPECLKEKIDGCKNSPENSSASKVVKHIPSGFSVSTISSFKSIENKYDVFRGKKAHNEDN